MPHPHLTTSAAHARPVENRPVRSRGKRGPKPFPVDEAAVAAALADLDAKAAALAAAPRPRGSNVLPATGSCHGCDRPVSGQRRFCGPCAAQRPQ